MACKDAAAICDAASRPESRFLLQKLIPQQDMQMLHRIRIRLVETVGSWTIQIRGLLSEYAILLPMCFIGCERNESNSQANGIHR
jgi:transposase